jgi:cytochrome P450
MSDAATSRAVPQLDVDPFTDEVLRDPIPFYDRLREAGPARVLQSEGYDLVAVGRDRDVREVYSDAGRFLSSRGSGVLDLRTDEPFREPGALLENDPPVHTPIRAVITDVISPRNVRKLRQRFEAVAETIVDGLLDRGTFDAQADLAEAFPLQVIPDLVMGAPESGRENLLRYSTFLFESMGPQTPRARRAIGELGDIDPIREWITRGCSRANVGEGSLGALIWAAAEAGRITDAHAANMVRSLLGAGIDTTIHSLAFTVFHLATNPGEWQKVHEAPQRTRFAYDEALRLDSVVRQNFRTPAEDTEIGGVPVREGQKIMLAPGAANRDPERWGSQAHVYDIDRQAGGHLSLGKGVHQCVGAPIARLEAESLLGALARRVRRVELAGEPEVLLNNTLRGFERLPLRVVPA